MSPPDGKPDVEGRPPTDGGVRRVRWAWREEARVCGAEALGAALLVLLSCLPPPGSGERAAAAGLVVAALVQCFDHVSGAMFNPTVTLAAWLWGRVGAPRAAAALCAQLAGCTLGAVALQAAAAAGAAGAVTRPAAAAGPWCAALVEAAASAVLALANCAAWDARNHGLRDSWPLRIGATVAALSLVAGDISGASMNPARSFGPALVAAAWDYHWVYWAGPLGGATLATSLYVCVWRPPRGGP